MPFLLLLVLFARLAFPAPAPSTEEIRRQFLNPPREFTQVPFWFWNSDINETGIREQISSMLGKGVHGFVIHPRMGLSKKVGYLTPRWLELVKFAVEEAARRKMVVYLYDEGMYPSGSAHGEVVRGRPDLASQGLAMDKGAAPVGGDVVAAAGGYVFRLVPTGGVIRGVHYDEEDNQPGAPKSADLLNPEATARFIRFTHERYRQALGEHFGKTIKGIFTDEPSIMGRRARKGLRPWTKGLLPKINQIIGYDLAPHLRLLWQESPDGLHEIVRADYRRAIAAVLNQTYYKPLSEWCERNGIALTGHPSGGGDMPPQRYFQQPGQDVVWRWVLPGETSLGGEHSLTAKTASSMALHLGRDTVVNECYGAFGWRLTMSEMKWLADWLFVRGTNLLMPHAFYYSVEGRRLYERPPDLAWSNLWWDHYQQFSNYTNRLSWLMRGGEPVADVAVLAIGGEARWRAAKALFQSQTEFFYVDEAMLDTAMIRDGRLRVGPADYSVVVLDGADHLRPETFERIGRLVRGGVKVIAYNSLLRPHPLLPDRRPPNQRALRVVRAGDANSLIAAIRGASPPDLVANPPTPALRYAHRIKQGTHFYLLTNEGDERIQTRVLLRQPGLPELWNPETGRMGTPRYDRTPDRRLRIEVDLPPRNSLILAFPKPAKTGAAPSPTPSSTLLPSTGWRLTAGGHTFPAVSFGDWTRLRGLASFSGTAWYERELPIEPQPGQRLELDLGDVREFAEVEVNSRSVGVRLWPPYRFDITPAVKDGPNTIRIGVTNTRANELTDEKLPSGLLGPVRLLTSGVTAAPSLAPARPTPPAALQRHR